MGCVIKYKGQSIPEEQFLQYLNKQIAINNLFNENESLANAVYEALGIKSATVSFKIEPFGKSIDNIDVIKDGEKIGYVQVSKNNTTKVLTVSGIELKEKGFGKNVYLNLQRQYPNFTIKSDAKNLSQDAVNMWDSLVSKKLATKEGDKQYTLNTQQAQQLYSQYLESLNKPNTNPILQGNQTNIEEIITQLEKAGLLEIDCKGKLKAEKGLAISFTKGGKWKIYEIFEGKSHKQGGIDINIKNNQISFTNKNGSIKAKYGLVISKENKL